MAEILVEECYRKIESPDTLFSGPFGPCIVAGAIVGNKAFMSHDPGDPVYLQELLSDIRGQSGVRLKVFGGGLDYSPSFNRQTIFYREKAAMMIWKAGFDISADWLERDVVGYLRLRPPVDLEFQEEPCWWANDR